MSLRERGAGALLLSLTMSACVFSSSAPAPASPAVPLTSSAALARDAALIFVRISAYDYALAGSFAGERVRVVTPDRYVAGLSVEPFAIATFKDKVVKAAFAEASVAQPLVEVADASVRVAGDLQHFADVRDEPSFARTVEDVEAAWSMLRHLAAVLPPDEGLASSIRRGMAWSVIVARSASYEVMTSPFATRDEALAAARRIGTVEQVATVSPFTVRVLTSDSRPAADKRVSELRDLDIAAATVETERLSFVRRGPDPGAELWREPAVDIATQDGARRAGFVASGIVVVSIDGSAYSFDDLGRAKWRVKLNAGPTFVTPASGGGDILVGGQFAQLLTSDGQPLGSATRLPSSAAGAVWVDRRRVFVVASQGPTGQPEGGGGAVAAIGLDGKALGDPFPLVTPAAGPALASSLRRDEVYIATTSQGTTDVEAIRPGIDDKTRTVARVAGPVVDLAVDDAGSYGALVTASGTYRFKLGVPDSASTLERIGPVARDVVFDRDGMLYVLFADRLVSYDSGLRQQWMARVGDGRRILPARRIVVQDGLRRLLVVDRDSGAVDELASLGDADHVAISPDGGRVLLLVEGRRAVIFQLP